MLKNNNKIQNKKKIIWQNALFYEKIRKFLDTSHQKLKYRKVDLLFS